MTTNSPTRRPPVCAALLLLLVLLPGAQAARAAGSLPPDPLPGRLFHTAAERAGLDRESAASAAAPRWRQPTPRPLPRAQPAERSDQLSGFVLRSDGHDSYWLQGAGAAAPKR
ncbi:MAG: hypothetical protein KGI67_13420 [Pseudomonadota bacterium]|nr:hypothetical protein [Pseudomonadota bacterium]